MNKIYIGKDGYRRFSDSDKLVHIWVAKKKYGEKAIQGMEVHHIDGNKINNDKENLVLVNKEDHYNITKFESKQRFLFSILFILTFFTLFAFWFIQMTEFLNEDVLGILVYIGLSGIFLIFAELRYKFVSSIILKRYVEDEKKK